MLRKSLLRLSRDERVREAVLNAPGAPELVSRFVAGSTTDQVVAVAEDLISKGLLVIVDLLGEDAHDTAAQRKIGLDAILGL